MCERHSVEDDDCDLCELERKVSELKALIRERDLQLIARENGLHQVDLDSDWWET